MSWNTCKVKNISGGEKTFYNKTLADDEEYTIPDSDRDGWLNQTIYSNIGSDDLQVGDGSAYLTDYVEQWNWLCNRELHVAIEKTPPFAEPLYRTKHASAAKATCAANASQTIDYQLTSERYCSGGFMVVKNGQYEDWVKAQVYDKDGVIPSEYRASLCENWPVVAEYITKEWIKYLGQTYTVHEINTEPLNAKISAGLYLRVQYNAANSGSTREILTSYDLTKKL